MHSLNIRNVSIYIGLVIYRLLVTFKLLIRRGEGTACVIHLQLY